jgi:hypothetical protein
MSTTTRTIASIGMALCGLLAFGAPSASAAATDAEISGCVTCHLDEKLLVKNLGASTARKSALQSGAG